MFRISAGAEGFSRKFPSIDKRTRPTFWTCWPLPIRACQPKSEVQSIKQGILARADCSSQTAKPLTAAFSLAHIHRPSKSCHKRDVPDLVKHGRFSQGPTMVGCLVALCPSANTGGGGFSWPLYFSLYLCSEQAGWGDRAVYHYTYICIYTYIFKNQCRASSPSLVVHLLIDFMNRICCLFFNNYTSIVVCMEINIYIYMRAFFVNMFIAIYLLICFSTYCRFVCISIPCVKEWIQPGSMDYDRYNHAGREHISICLQIWNLRLG